MFFFVQLGDMSKYAMKQICSTSLVTENFAKNDTLFKQLRRGRHMYFCTRGTLAYRYTTPGKDKAQATIQLETNQWCCEHVLWMHWAHRGTMKGLTDFEVVVMTAGKFAEVLGHATSDVFQFACEQGSRFAAYVQCLTSFGEAYVTDFPPELMARFGVQRARDMTIKDEIRRAEAYEIQMMEFSDSESEAADSNDGENDV